MSTQTVEREIGVEPDGNLPEPQASVALDVRHHDSPRDEPRVVTPRVERVAEPPKPVLAQPPAVFHSEQINEVVGALAKAQGEFGDVERTLTAKVNSKRTGTNFEYSYEDMADLLAATRPHLSKNGLAIIQLPTTMQRGVSVMTMLAHSSGQWIRNTLVMPVESGDAQAIGSAISYARRYAYKSMLGIAPSATEDDDGARASALKEPPRAAQRTSQQPTAPAEPRGKIVAMPERGGALLPELSSGFVCSTRDPELATALHKARATGAEVELRCRPSSDPAKYAPVLEEIILLAK